MLDTLNTYTAVTEGIQINVRPQYLDDQSEPEDGHFVWAYTVIIQNNGTKTVQLLNRYWHTTDANGHVKEVEGPGVVGEQPTLHPGEEFQYTSGTPLQTPSGIMRGRYEMEDKAGGRFYAEIPAFSLDSPQQFNRPN